MAKLSSILKNEKRKVLVERRKSKRDALKAVIYDRNTSNADRMAAVFKLAQESRNASPVRVRNRCSLSGRPRGYYRDFGISRIAIRDLGSFGKLPGLRKASW